MDIIEKIKRDIGRKEKENETMSKEIIKLTKMIEENKGRIRLYESFLSNEGN